MIRRGHSSSPTATKAAIELGVREAFDALSARVEATGGTVACVLITGATESRDGDSGAFTMGEGFRDVEDSFNFALMTATAMGAAIGIPVHVGLTHRINGDG